MYYDPDKDQSERFGWKKVCDERRPTEEEQDRWGKISLIIVAILTPMSFFIPN